MQFGPPRELYERPASRFVASFLGVINLFEGRAVRHTGSQVTFEVADGSTLFAQARGAPVEGCCAVGFRPEKAVIADAPTGLANDFAGTVERVSYCGNLSHVTVRVSGERLIEATLINAGRVGGAGPGVSDFVHVGFDADAGVVLYA